MLVKKILKIIIIKLFNICVSFYIIKDTDMSHKEFIRLLESNIFILDRLADKLKRDPVLICGYPKQQISVLVRLNIGGKAKLKDIARRECVTTPNLCASFRKLERDGLVLRTIDEKDRRNTWYSCTAEGEVVAKKALDVMRTAIEKMFEKLSAAEEEILTVSLKNINSILTNMEIDNA